MTILTALGINPFITYASGSTSGSINHTFAVIGSLIIIFGILLRKIIHTAFKFLLIAIGLFFIIHSILPYYL
jgi:large-conductance mechanosensitive channel